MPRRCHGYAEQATAARARQHGSISESARDQAVGVNRRRLTYGVIGLASIGAVGASAQDWTMIGPAGGEVSRVASDERGTVYSSNGELLFRWNSGAGTWQLLRNAPGGGVS